MLRTFTYILRIPICKTDIIKHKEGNPSSHFMTFGTPSILLPKSQYLELKNNHSRELTDRPSDAIC